MYRLTERRLLAAHPILERHLQHIHAGCHINTAEFERELRQCWGLGLRELRDLVIQLMKIDRYTLLAAFYMHYRKTTGVSAEFQKHLAKLYGVKSYSDASWSQKAEEFWKRALVRKAS